MRDRKGWKFEAWQYWILSVLSQAHRGRLSLTELRPLVFEKMKPYLTESDCQPTPESKGKPSWDAQLRGAIYWNEKDSLKARKLILHPERETYEITPEGRAHLETYKEPPSNYDSEDYI
jgi:hypothetical protein